MTSVRGVTFVGAGTILTAEGTTFSLGGMLGGTGEPTKTGAGTLVITADTSGYTAHTQVAGGTLAVNGVLGGAVGAAAAGRLEGTGRVAGVTHAGRVTPESGGIANLPREGTTPA